MQPDHGTLVLVLGILSLVLCGPVGIAAWILGNSDLKEIDAGSIFALELGTMVAGYGYVGIEENVVVTPTAAEYLSQPQYELILLP